MAVLHPLTHVLICLLMGCIPLQAMAMVMAHIEGAAHVHTRPTLVTPPASASLPAGMPMLLSVNDWRHSHGAPRQEVQQTRADLDAHTHAEPARHLHQPGDDSVLQVGDGTAGIDAAAGNATKRVLLDVDAPLRSLVAPAGEALRRPPAPPDAVAWAQAPGDRVERPPRSVQR